MRAWKKVGKEKRGARVINTWFTLISRFFYYFFYRHKNCLSLGIFFVIFFLKTCQQQMYARLLNESEFVMFLKHIHLLLTIHPNRSKITLKYGINESSKSILKRKLNFFVTKEGKFANQVQKHTRKSNKSIMSTKCNEIENCELNKKKSYIKLILDFCFVT